MVKDQKTSSNVIVKAVKPEFIKKLEDVEVKELQTAILEVEITSKSADVTWHKNGEILTSKSDKFEMQKEGPVRKLLIRNISVHDDGEYTCSLGDQESTAEVTVVELPPEIIGKLEDKKVTVDERVTFDIELTKGDALVHWYKDNKEIQFNDNVKLTIDGKRQTLEIVKATLSDTGVYSCTVGDQKSKAKLTVEKPLVTLITKLPDVTIVPLNTDSTLTVKLSQSNVENGKPIKPSEKFEIIDEGATKKLVIKKAKLDDQDEYTCVAGNVKTKTTLKIEVIEKVPTINFDSFVKEYKVKKGESVTFDVSYTATSKPNVEWFVNGNVVKKSNKVKSTYSESAASLTIEKVEEVDVGSYTIRISNEHGEASADLTLIMIELPGAPDAPTIIEITDTSITVHWKPPSNDGNSPIKSYILEYHDKEEFMVWHKIETAEVTYKVTELVTNHEITFKVAAVNDAGVGAYSDSTRYVKVSSPKGMKKPTIEEPLKDTTVGLRQPISLTCVVTGVPIPEIKWLKDGKIIKTKNVSYENNVAKFTLTETTEQSEGTYTCRAINDAGSVETNCKLSIQEIPKIEIDDNSSSQILLVKNQWKVEVKYRGYPQPKITWSKSGEPIEDEKCKIYYDEGSTTIAIYSVERPNTGTYTVTATNSAGSASANLQLKVIDEKPAKRRFNVTVEEIDKPSKPIGPLLLTDITSDSVELEWKPPVDDGGLELKYNVEKCEIEKMIWSKAGEVRDITIYNVQKLLEDAEYMFRVSAENSVGVSEYLQSEPVTVKCKYRKPSPPQGPIQISDMTDTSMTIAWLPPLDDGGLDILDYTVEKKETEKKAWQKVGITKETSISVTELIKGSAYNLRIFARNRVGLGLPYMTEEIIAGKRITPPTAPVDLKIIGITGKSATLQWSPPESNGGLELTGYVIEKQLKKDKWLKVVTLEPNILQFHVENLKEKSEYYFKVYAENPVGLSPAAKTDLVKLETHATVPSPPTAPLEIRSVSANAVDVEWGVPETDGGSPLTGYAIAIKDVKKTMWMEVGRVDADVQKLTVRDLQENHEYLIRIFARNEIGLSEPLESDEPYKVQKPTGFEEDTDIEETVLDKPSMSLSSEPTSSWMREAGMDADIHTYASGSLLKRSEYFFRIWYYAKQLFK